MKTISLISLTLTLAACQPVEVNVKSDAPSTTTQPGDSASARTTDPTPETPAYETPYRPTSICVPHYITHLSIKYSVQTACWNRVYVQYNQPNWKCSYNLISAQTPDGASYAATRTEINNAFKAMLYDHYGFTPSLIGVSDEGSTGNILMPIVRDYYVSDRDNFISGYCSASSPEDNITLD